jgi:hypothetical protein
MLLILWSGGRDDVFGRNSCEKSEQDAIVREVIAKLRPEIPTAVEIQLQDCPWEKQRRFLGSPVPAAKAGLFHARTPLSASAPALVWLGRDLLASELTQISP